MEKNVQVAIRRIIESVTAQSIEAFNKVEPEAIIKGVSSIVDSYINGDGRYMTASAARIIGSPLELRQQMIPNTEAVVLNEYYQFLPELSKKVELLDGVSRATGNISNEQLQTALYTVMQSNNYEYLSGGLQGNRLVEEFKNTVDRDEIVLLARIMLANAGIKYEKGMEMSAYTNFISQQLAESKQEEMQEGMSR